MNSVIAIQDLRERFDSFAKKAKGGESFVVVEGTEPIFQIGPVEEEWEDVEKYAHADRIRNSYLDAVEKYPPSAVVV